MLIQTNSWKPSLRKIRIQPKPEWVPDEVYKEAVGAKWNYNEKWELLVYQTSIDYNVSQQIAEEALLRGLIKEFYKMRVIYGDKIGIWFEDFMEMGDIFRKIKLPEYKAQLGDAIGPKHENRIAADTSTRPVATDGSGSESNRNGVETSGPVGR